MLLELIIIIIIIIIITVIIVIIIIIIIIIITNKKTIEIFTANMEFEIKNAFFCYSTLPAVFLKLYFTCHALPFT